MKIIDGLIDWLDERTGLKKPIIDMATHLVPPGSRWFYVFGTAVLTSFIIQVVTGVALATAYIPSAGQAYESLRYISNVIPFGSLVRGLHYFGASSMVLFAGIHMMRVYLMGSYKFPRELNWLTGVVLLFLTIAMGFSGQVLRWDQTAVWTVAVGAEQALRAPYVGRFLAQVLFSGPTVGSSTLSHFFALHVFIFPGLLIGVLVFHLFLVLRNGISEPPKLSDPVDPNTYKEQYQAMLHSEGKPFWPDAAWRDIVFSTIVVVGIFALAIWIGPPQIDKPPDPSVVNAQPRPDWYLVWYFALLALLPHEAEDVLIILFPILAAVGLFVVPFVNNQGERSIRRRPWAVAIVICVLTAIGTLTYEGYKEPWVPKFEATRITARIVGTDSGPVYDGAQVFNDKGCLFCHTFAGHGGKRGPDLTDVANRLTHEQMIVRIVNGGYNMPGYAGNITPEALQNLISFLESRKNKVPPPAPIPDAEKALIREIAQDGMTEIKLGELAVAKGSSAEVKSFGSRMVKEHTTASNELMAAAVTAKITLPKKISKEQQLIYDELSKLSGKDFDDKYMSTIIDAHSKAVTAIDLEAKHGTGELKTWAQQTISTIKRHHHSALKVESDAEKK